MNVNSYDPDALVPKIGTRWMWELDSTYARALVEVVEVVWNGEEWWVRTKTLLPVPLDFPGRSPETHLNDLGRFWEACVPVLPKMTGRVDQFAHRIPAVVTAGDETDRNE